MDSVLLLSSLLLLVARVSSDCSNLPPIATDEDIPKNLQDNKFVQPQWGSDKHTVVCQKGYMFYILHRGIASFFVEDTELKCSISGKTKDSEWKLPGGYKLDSKDEITCYHGHIKDHDICHLTLNNQKIFVPRGESFRCPNGKVILTAGGEKELHSSLKCDNIKLKVKTNLTRFVEAPHVECEEPKEVTETEEPLVKITTKGTKVTTENPGCSVPHSSASIVADKYPTHSTPKINNDKLICPAGMKFYIKKEGQDGRVVKDEFKCVNGIFKSLKFSLGEKDMVICVDDSVVLPPSEEVSTSATEPVNPFTITTPDGCSIGVANKELIIGSYKSISSPSVVKNELRCKSGQHFYVTREDSIAYLIKDSFICVNKSFVTNSFSFPLDAKDSIADCEVNMEGHLMTVVNEIQCPAGHNAYIDEKRHFLDGKRIKCINGTIDCMPNTKEMISCLSTTRQCSYLPSFTSPSNLPAPFNISHDPKVLRQNIIRCSEGHNLLITRDDNVAFLIENDLHCTNNKWEIWLGKYQIHEKDSITCVPVDLYDHKSCGILFDGQKMFLVNEIYCPDGTKLTIDDGDYEKTQTISCKNGRITVCDTTFSSVHNRTVIDAKCVHHSNETIGNTEEEVTMETDTSPRLKFTNPTTTATKKTTTTTIPTTKPTPKPTTTTTKKPTTTTKKPTTTTKKPTTTTKKPTTTTKQPTTTKPTTKPTTQPTTTTERTTKAPPTTVPTTPSTPAPTPPPLRDTVIPTSLCHSQEWKHTRCMDSFRKRVPPVWNACDNPTGVKQFWKEGKNCFESCYVQINKCGQIILASKADEAKKACPLSWHKIKPLAFNRGMLNINGEGQVMGYVSTEKGVCGATQPVKNILTVTGAIDFYVSLQSVQKKRMITRLFLVLLLLHLSFCRVFRDDSFSRSYRIRRSTDEWNCGNGLFSDNLAYYMTYFSNQRGINRCCTQHDNELFYYARRTADHSFCSCLDNLGSFYTRWFVQPVFCTAVRAYSALYY